MTIAQPTLVDEAIAQIEALMSVRRKAFCSQPLHREISMPQLYILMVLEEHGPTTVTDLAHLLRISAPSASSIVDRMEEHGLVERARDEADRRVVHVRLLDRGRRLMNEVTGLKRDGLQRVLATLSDEELEHVIRAAEALQRAAHTVTAQLTAVPPPRADASHPHQCPGRRLPGRPVRQRARPRGRDRR
jgi:DNA-binding MarR family transcriptional regulator